MKTLEQNLLAFFESRRGEVWDSGELDKMEFKNHRGSRSKPETIGRALRRLAETGQLHRVDSVSAKYTLTAPPKKKSRFVLDEKRGVMVEIINN